MSGHECSWCHDIMLKIAYKHSRLLMSTHLLIPVHGYSGAFMSTHEHSWTAMLSHEHGAMVPRELIGTQDHSGAWCHVTMYNMCTIPISAPECSGIIGSHGCSFVILGAQELASIWLTKILTFEMTFYYLTYYFGNFIYPIVTFTYKKVKNYPIKNSSKELRSQW